MLSLWVLPAYLFGSLGPIYKLQKKLLYYIIRTYFYPNKQPYPSNLAQTNLLALYEDSQTPSVGQIFFNNVSLALVTVRTQRF